VTHMQIDLHAIAAERIVPLTHMVRIRQHTEMARVPAVIKDHLLIELA
jgi:hypothetical protein